VAVNRRKSDNGGNPQTRAASDLLAAVRQAARQEQFLEVVSAEEARKRFESRLDLSPLPAERVALSAALGRVLAHDLAAPTSTASRCAPPILPAQPTAHRSSFRSTPR
jgi:hypothetical protein